MHQFHQHDRGKNKKVKEEKITLRHLGFMEAFLTFLIERIKNQEVYFKYTKFLFWTTQTSKFYLSWSKKGRRKTFLYSMIWRGEVTVHELSRARVSLCVYMCMCTCVSTQDKSEEEGKFFMEQFEPSNLNKEPCIHTKECARLISSLLIRKGAFKLIHHFYCCIIFPSS